MANVAMMPLDGDQPVPQVTRPPLPDCVDISLVTWNSADWLERLFNSLVGGRWPAARIRLLVRDNGSGDNTLPRLEQLSRRFESVFSEIVIVQGDNIGFGRGHNDNFERVRSEFVLIINPDLSLDKDALAGAVEFAVTDAPRVAAWEMRQRPWEHPKHYDPATLETSWCSACCLLLRSEAVHQIRGFEPQLFLYGEDVELSFRLRAMGWKLRYLPFSACQHDTYRYAGENKPLQLLGSIRADILIRSRYGRWRDQWPGLLRALHLLFGPRRIPRQRSRTLQVLWRALCDRRSFRLFDGRRLPRLRMPRADFARTRSGAFHETLPLPPDPPLVSVIVRTMAGRAGGLVQALASLANQTWPRLEVIVVEDGSNQAGNLVEKFHHIQTVDWRHVPLAKHCGRSVAGNAGLAASQGELICFLDDDDMLYADHVETLAAALRKNPEAGAAFSLAWEVPTEIHDWDPWRARERGWIERGIRRFSHELLQRINFLPIQSVLFRRSLYLQYGGFDERVDILEDWNLWVRYSADVRFVPVPKVTSLYRTPASRRERLRRQLALDRALAEVRCYNAEALNGDPGVTTAERGALRRSLNACRRFLRYALMCFPLIDRLLERCARWRRRYLAYRAGS